MINAECAGRLSLHSSRVKYIRFSINRGATRCEALVGNAFLTL
jgi:hypothetical protein